MSSLALFPRVFVFVLIACVGASLQGGVSVAAEHVHVCRYCSRLAVGSDDADSSERKYAPDRLVDVLHIHLDVTPDFEKQTVSGTATIRFTPISRSLRTLRLDGERLEVAAVRGTRAIEDFSVSDVDLQIVFNEPIEPGEEAEVSIDYSAEPRKGLYFCTPENGTSEEDIHLWTQGEPHEARHWYPCFDYPNERSTTEVTVHVPEEMTALSNGKLVGERRDAGARTRTFHWLQDKSHANYLVCLIAGKLSKLEKSARDVPLAFFTQPSLAEHADHSFADTQQILAFYEDEIGVPFPWAKYYQATVADFMWGGMENTTLTTLTQRTLFDDSTENVYQSRTLDAHEMAHQWFGDYVTCKDWSHLWLNEGFATYYTLLYEGRKFGRDAMLYGLYRDAVSKVLVHKNDRRPIVYRNYAAPKEQFDFRAYPKGSWLLHMLRSRLGDDVFRKAVRNYLEKHALGYVDTSDLRDAMEKASGLTLDRFFDQWAYQGGCPQLKIKYEWLAEEKTAHVTIEQTQESTDDDLLFAFDTQLTYYLPGDSQVENAPPKSKSVDIQVDKRRHEFYTPLAEEPIAIRFDPHTTLLADVDFSKPQAMWLTQLELKDDAIGRCVACVALGKKKTKRAVEALQRSLQNDEFYGVRCEASRALRKIASPEAVAALAASTDQDDARVRLQVVDDLSELYDPSVEKKLLEIASQASNPAIVSQAIRGLGRYQSEAAREAVRRALGDESFRREPVEAAFEAIRDMLDEELAPDVLRALEDQAEHLSGYAFEAGFEAVAQLCRRQDDDRLTDEAMSKLTDSLHSPRRAVRVAAVKALGTLGDRRAAALLRSIADQEDGGALAEEARDALKRLDRETRLAPREVRELRKELERLQEVQDEHAELIEKLEARE
ncbi:MAG: HEAT repeat domain-containing protein [Planctomycetales bacterium]|nr:HEAT repeat domain-containing protein [Planctomycetales bacterium]